MNKQMKYWLALGFAAIAYHVIAFGVPFERNNCFYISWAFTLTAFAVEIYVLNTVFFTGGDVKRLVYGLPVARIGSLYLILQILFGFVFMGIGTKIEVPLWIPIVLFAIMLCIAGELFTAATGARNAALYQDNAQKASTAPMRSLQARIMLIAASASQSPAGSDLHRLMELFRYSDPVSSDALAGIEGQLEELLSQLQIATASQDTAAIHGLCETTENVLKERNLLCRSNKS